MEFSNGGSDSKASALSLSMEFDRMCIRLNTVPQCDGRKDADGIGKINIAVCADARYCCIPN